MFLACVRNAPDYVTKYIPPLIAAYYFVARLLFYIWYWFKPKISVNPPGDPLLFFSATKAAGLIMQQQLAASDLMDSYIRRIEEINPFINALAYKNYEEAIKMAKDLDDKMERFTTEERTAYCKSRPLIGVPFTVKDSFLIAGKPTTSGVYARRNYIADETAEVVQRMQNAGAILLATTTTSEYCTWIETSSKNFGITNNPFDLRRTAGGCSGGEAAIIGAGGSLIGIASDYVGSLRQPAFFNGVFGLMPSAGIVPNHGHFPKIDGSNSFKSVFGRVGCMCRYAEDLPLILEIISAQPLPREITNDIRLFYSEGLSECLFIEPTSQSCLDSLFQSLSFMEEFYEIQAEKMEFPESRWIYEMMFTSYRQYIYEPLMADVMNDSWNRLESKDQTNCLREFLRYIRGKSNHSLPGILYGLTDESNELTLREREMYAKMRDSIKAKLISKLTPNGLLFYPSFPTKATFHGELIVKRVNLFHSILFNLLGVPAIQCPMGVDTDGIPQGIMIVGAPGVENLLTDAATKIAKEFGGWVPPGMTGTL